MTSINGHKAHLIDNWAKKDDDDEVEEFTGFTILEMWPDVEDSDVSEPAGEEPDKKRVKFSDTQRRRDAQQSRVAPAEPRL